MFGLLGAYKRRNVARHECSSLVFCEAHLQVPAAASGSVSQSGWLTAKALDLFYRALGRSVKSLSARSTITNKAYDDLVPRGRNLGCDRVGVGRCPVRIVRPWNAASKAGLTRRESIKRLVPYRLVALRTNAATSSWKCRRTSSLTYTMCPEG